MNDALANIIRKYCAVSWQCRSSTMFSVLGLCSDAKLRDVRRAYRRLALVHHPDRGGDATKFREITDAFEQITQGSAGGLPQDDACSQPMARADNVRVLISTPWDLLTIDERRIWLGEKPVSDAAAGESFLCACLLSDGKVAAGSNRGRIHVVDPWEAEPPVCVALERSQEVIAVCEAQAGWLLLSVGGEVVLLDLASEVILRRFVALAGVQVEALCPLLSPASQHISTRPAASLIAAGAHSNGAPGGEGGEGGRGGEGGEGCVVRLDGVHGYRGVRGRDPASVSAHCDGDGDSSDTGGGGGGGGGESGGESDGGGGESGGESDGGASGGGVSTWRAMHVQPVFAVAWPRSR